jgi:ComF family protein
VLSRSLAPGATMLARALGTIAQDALAFVLPQRCPVCGDPASHERFLCDPCARALPRLGVTVCARCLSEERVPDACVRHPGDRVHAAFDYDERVALLVHAIKFGARPGLARGYVAAMAEALPRPRRRPAVVTAVPLHPTRRRERGYDQAAAIGEALADAIGAPFSAAVLERGRDTRAQSSLGPRARRDNVRGAFHVRKPGWVRGRKVLVVDDVLTTGATLAECLGELRAAGARTAGAVLAWAQ